MVLPSEYEISSEPPAVDDYLRLRKITGLSEFSALAAERGLIGTLFGVSLLYKETVIGMGRIVGDGGLFFQIVDIAVDPDHQGRGLGISIVSKLMEYLQENAPLTAYVSLMADVPANKLYEKFGFRETAPNTVGMALSLK